MPADSYIKAVEDKIATLTAANFPALAVPKVWFDEAPQQGTTGSQQHVPYVVLTDEGARDEWDFETNAISVGGFKLQCFSRSLGDADAMLKAILWNGANPNLRLGLAFATLSLNPPLYPLSVTPTRSKRSYAGVDYQAQRVHVSEQSFDVVVQLRGTG